MVFVTTTIESDSVQELDLPRGIALSLAFGLLLEEVVKVGDVGPVVLAVMIIEGLSTHDWLKGSHLIGEVLQDHTAWLGHTGREQSSCCLHLYIMINNQDYIII